MEVKAITLAGLLLVTAAVAKDGDTHAQDEAAAVAALNAELPSLWDWSAISRDPLDVEIVSSNVRDGYKVESVYLNGVGDAAGKDRIFFYYAHPEKPTGKFPVVIDLTGGSVSDGRCLYLAKAVNGACVDLEWRCGGATLRSKWAGGEPPKYRGLGPLKADQAYRVVSGARRILDFLSKQDDADPARLASMGGSMGGIYTLLLSGVDTRISAGVSDVGVGHLAHSDCAQGAFNLSPERKDLWLKAFDPYSHAGAIKAKIAVVSSSDDHFCALGDIVETYTLIHTEKRLCIDANADHSNASFGGRPMFPGLWKWLPYCFGQVDSYMKIPETLQRERAAYWLPTGGEEVKEAYLYWSPGGKDLIWQARYWAEVKAEVRDGKCRAEIPARYAGLPRCVFMNVYNSKGQMASTIPVFLEGTGSERPAPLLWDGDQLWDTKSGLEAWRPVVLADPRIPRKANLQFVPPYGLLVGPDAGKANPVTLPGLANPNESAAKKFVIVTSSIGLAAAAAPRHAGLCFEIDGHGLAGELKLSLYRNFNSAFAEEEFRYSLAYGKGVQRYTVPWGAFTPAKAHGTNVFPFDTLRIDGVRENGSPITIKYITFADNAADHGQSLAALRLR